MVTHTHSCMHTWSLTHTYMHTYTQWLTRQQHNITHIQTQKRLKNMVTQTQLSTSMLSKHLQRCIVMYYEGAWNHTLTSINRINVHMLANKHLWRQTCTLITLTPAYPYDSSKWTHIWMLVRLNTQMCSEMSASTYSTKHRCTHTFTFEWEAPSQRHVHAHTPHYHALICTRIVLYYFLA